MLDRTWIAAALAAFLGAAAAPALGQAPTLKDGVLVDGKGMTLYTFDRDTAGSGKSACNGDCAAKWPPHLATAADKPSGDYTIVQRDDGQLQWAHKGKPLYTWVEDRKPGDRRGDNVNKVWHVAQ